MNENNFESLPLILTPKHVSDILNWKKNAVYELFRCKTFPSEKVGSKYIIPKIRFLKWLEEAESHKKGA